MKPTSELRRWINWEGFSKSFLLAACPQRNEAGIRKNQFSWKSFFQWVTVFGIVLILEIGLTSSPLFAVCVESVEPKSVSVGAAGGLVNAVQVQTEDLATFPDSCDTQDANSSGSGQGLVFAATDTGLVLAEAATPTKAGDVVVIWCAGVGEVDQPVTAGEGAPSSPPLAKTADTVTVTIGGIDATVQFAGLAPGFTGLYHVNVVVPEGVQSGDDVPVVLNVAGQSSPPVTVALQ